MRDENNLGWNFDSGKIKAWDEDYKNVFYVDGDETVKKLGCKKEVCVFAYRIFFKEKSVYSGLERFEDWCFKGMKVLGWKMDDM